MQQQQQQQQSQPQQEADQQPPRTRRIWTVRLTRGEKGFGFTISGQQPCILSAVEPNSPAERAGLRTGHYLVAVNGHGVTKAFHDNVVMLIGRSNGLLKLKVAEEVAEELTDDAAVSYKTDSSDDDDASQAKVRARPRYRSRSSTALASTEMVPALQPQCRVAKVVKDLHSGAMFSCRMSVPNLHRWSMSSPPLPPPPPASRKRDSEKIVHRAVLGYLGTIDIPNHLQSVSMMSLVRKCIKRIKAENRNPTTVLLTIHVANIKLTNMEGRLIAEYSSNRIVYCNSFSNEDKLHFGILTKIDAANTDETNNCEIDNASNSCHVFKIYTNITDHSVHCNMSDIFGFSCTKASELNNTCQEFPSSCEGLVGAIQTLYIADTADRNANLFDNRRSHRDGQPSPQPSNMSSSTIHSSNSDSGIGFRDDCYCHLDRNFNAELPPRYYERSIVVSSLGRNKDYSGSKLTVRAVSDSRWNDCPRPFRASQASSLSDQQLYSNELEDYPEARILAHCHRLKESRRRRSGGSGSARHSSGGEGSIISCPANVPSAASTTRSNRQQQQRTSPKALAALARSPRYTSTLSVGSLHPSTPATRSKSNGNFFGMQHDLDVPDRLSPKVYTNGMKIQGYSMENLKTSPGAKSTQSDYSTTKSLPHSHTGKANDKMPRAWGSLQEIRKVAGCEHDDCLMSHGSNESCDKATGCGVHTWALSFEKLLEDPKGLQTFAKYLKKEISHENIYFWAACERYSDTEDLAARKRLAAQIYQRHLSNNAPEPVNVDSQAAGQITPELLESAPTELFAQAQKQVFNLMKFDSYPRFLRSDIYRRCVEHGYDPEDTTPEDNDLFLTNSPSLKKTHSNAEDRSRKSILPWNRKNRSKSKDRGESEYNKTPSRGEKIYKSFSTIQRDNEGNNNNDEDNVSISSSRSSLASWDLALRQSFTKHSSYEGQSNDNKDALGSKCTGLCRVILPDGSTTVIPTNHSESVRDVLTRLLDKRALRYANYDVIVLATDEIINLKNPSSVLATQEVEVVPTKVIKVDLPSRRVISVVAHKGRTLKEVLKPLLNKYGFKLDLVTIWADGHPISVDIPASSAPPRLSLTSNNKEIVDDASLFKVPEVPKGQPTLDEITNKVFEELRVGKCTNKRDADEGSCKSDDQKSEKSEKSESSSILSGKIFSRDSTSYFRKKSKSKNSNTSEKSNSDGGNEEVNRPQPPLIAKWKNGVKLQLPSRFDGDSKDIYDGIKRAQKLRLEDQRGTEINFELPDFLKNKENGKTMDQKKRRKSRPASGHGDFSKFYDSEEEKPILDSTSSSLETTLVDADKTIGENGSYYFDSNKSCGQDHMQISPTKLMKPPPLPPKPKSLTNSLRGNAMPTRPFQRVVNCDKKTI